MTDFPETRWSLVLEGGAAPLEELARTYWKPVYGFVRARRARTDDDALDATQAFFLWMLESELLSRADPERGRFRALVKVSLDRFLTDRYRAETSQRRGGGRAGLPLHDAEGAQIDLPDVSGQSPEEALDALWRAGLVERAFERLRERLEADGRGQQFAVFRDHFLGEGEEGYDALAERHGVSRVDVSNWVTRTRQRFRDELRRVVLETVADARNLDEELAWLLKD